MDTVSPVVACWCLWWPPYSNFIYLIVGSPLSRSDYTYNLFSLQNEYTFFFFFFLLFFCGRVTAEVLVLPQMWIYTFPSTSPFSQPCICVIKYIGFSITSLQDGCTYRLFGRFHYYSEKKPVWKQPRKHSCFCQRNIALDRSWMQLLQKKAKCCPFRLQPS